MPFLDDIIYLLEGASVGTANLNLFATSKAAIPKGNGPFLSVTETGGTSPDYVQNQILPAYANPTAMLITRGLPGSAARTMLVSALSALCAVNNQLVNGTWYLWIHPMQEVGDRGLDPIERPMYGVNVMGKKRW